MIMAGTHDHALVALSIALAIFASYTALSLANRIRAAHGLARRTWLGAAALALGGGIWSMHFVAMLAFTMPGMPMSYDLPLTLLSLVIALLFTAAGFAIAGTGDLSPKRAAFAGLLMGAGVVAMHYIGMAAMRMPGTLSYEQTWVAFSILIAFGAATAAVWLASRERSLNHRMAAAVLMGTAISGVHFAGMRAAVFVGTGHAAHATGEASMGQANLALWVSGITVVILLLALGAARLERLFQGFAQREARIALRLKVADALREDGSPDTLHHVACLMGEHFSVARAGFGIVDPVADRIDFGKGWTDNAGQPLSGSQPIGAFDPRLVAQLKAGQTVAIGDLGQIAEVIGSPARRDGTQAVLVVPVLRHGELSTIVYLNDRKPRNWQPEDIAFVEELAERTRLVIERDAAERQLRELNATLEARVEARTSEVKAMQEALLQSQKMEAVGQLVSGIAHDFNNLLGAVVGAFELIDRKVSDTELVRRYTKAGLQAAERGAKLTGQLLAFARAQSIQLAPILVCDVITGMKDLLERTVGPMISLELELNPDPVPVLADPTQVEMVVLNLAINARDAMPDGGKIRVRTRTRSVCGDSELADGDYVELCVSDSGIGMDEATLRRAMDPFFTTKRPGKGTGLGLSQIYGSARQAGGTVRISSKVGAGTTVRVLLPRTDRDPQPLYLDDAAVVVPENLSKILIIDDDPDHRAVLAASLAEKGFHVAQAEDGQVGLSMVGSHAPQLILLDFAMPGMNGAEVARAVRALHADLPIVFMTGFADTQAIVDAMGPDVTILQKPFRLPGLLRAIADIGRGSDMRAAEVVETGGGRPPTNGTSKG